MKSKILIIEDETKYAYILEKFFNAEGFETCVAFDGAFGVKAFNEFGPDLVCLDIMLPKMDGYEVATKIREVSDCPIIMMSALSEERDILKGYELKIDDYVTKPFRTSILIAKAKTIIERRQSLLNNAQLKQEKREVISIKGIKLIIDSMQCIINDENVSLTKTEFKILEYLMTNVGLNCSRDSIIDAFWDGKDIDERIIDTYIKKLRRIVKPGGCEIKTAFGIGYRFEEGTESDKDETI